MCWHKKDSINGYSCQIDRILSTLWSGYRTIQIAMRKECKNPKSEQRGFVTTSFGDLKWPHCWLDFRTKSCKCFHTGSLWRSVSLLLHCQNPPQLLFQKLIKLWMPEMGRRAAIHHAAGMFTVGHCNKEVTSRLLYMISVESNYSSFQNWVLMEELLNVQVGSLNKLLRRNKTFMWPDSRVDYMILKRDFNSNDFFFFLT